MSDDSSPRASAPHAAELGNMFRSPYCFDVATEGALADAGRLVDLLPGERLPLGEATCLTCGILLSGILRYQRHGASGERQIVNLILPAEVVRAQRLTRSGYTVEAATPCRILTIPRTEFDQILSASPALQRADRDSLKAQIERLRCLTWSILALDACERIVAFLDCVSLRTQVEHLARGSFVIALPLARQDIADLLAISPSSLDRNLKKLERFGVIRVQTPDRIEVFDPRGLRAWAEQIGPTLDSADAFAHNLRPPKG